MNLGSRRKDRSLVQWAGWFPSKVTPGFSAPSREFWPNSRGLLSSSSAKGRYSVSSRSWRMSWESPRTLGFWSHGMIYRNAWRSWIFLCSLRLTRAWGEPWSKRCRWVAPSLPRVSAASRTSSRTGRLACWFRLGTTGRWPRLFSPCCGIGLAGPPTAKRRDGMSMDDLTSKRWCTTLNGSTMKSGRKSIPRRKSLLLGGCVALAVVLWIAVAEAGEPGQAWRPVTTVVHVHSDMSTGSDSIESLATQARSYGVETIILSANLLLRYEHGFFPLPRR